MCHDCVRQTMTHMRALCPFQRKQRPLRCDCGFSDPSTPPHPLLLCRVQGEDLRGSRGGNVKGWYLLCSLRGAVVVKNHTPPRPFGRDHHLGSSLSPTCCAKARHSYPRPESAASAAALAGHQPSTTTTRPSSALSSRRRNTTVPSATPCKRWRKR